MALTMLSLYSASIITRRPITCRFPGFSAYRGVPFANATTPVV